GYGEEPYSDTMGYYAALHYLRGRNEAPAEIAEVVDGVININILKHTGTYDQVVRRIFFQVVAEHPWPVLRSFVIGKPSDQFSLLFGTPYPPIANVPPLWDLHVYGVVLLLGLAASLLVACVGSDLGRWREVLIACIPLVICSWITPLIAPSVVITDVI